MTCKGICVRYKAQKPVGTGRYASGQRRCQICEIFIKWEGLWCPCCGYRLRTKPRNLKYKAKLRARVEADSIEAKAIAQEKQEEIVEEVVAVKVKAKAAKTTVKAKAAKTTVKAKAAKTTVKAKTRKTKAKDLPKTESIAIKA
jgi:tRNA(Ser,Leu) C12 N-acetylase TAN1